MEYYQAGVATTEPRLGSWIKLSYGVGLSAEGIKNNAFNLFLLFYYQQIVGLDSVLCGLALFIALCVGGIVDPAIGVVSDGLKSWLGRRHPFMYASIIPLAVAYFAVFVPPGGRQRIRPLRMADRVRRPDAGRDGVLHHSPSVTRRRADDRLRRTHHAAELRTVFAWLFGVLNALLAYTVFLAKTPEYPLGLLNPKGYPRLAIFGALVMLVATSLSSVATNRAALRARSGESGHRSGAGQHGLRSGDRL